MNKSELIDSVAERVGGRAAAATAVEAIIDSVTRTVAKGEKVAISGFGVFEKADRAARTGRNPATGAIVKIKKTSVPKFRPGSEFKAYVNGSKKFAKATAVKAVAAGRAAAKKAPARGAAKSTATATAKKTAAKKTVAKKTAVKRAPVRSAAKKTAAKKTTAKRAPASKSAARRRTR
ncbi:MAG TPA: HU family DNA-binding protein [Mycobacteriales bacterium]|nr:HU family DNA-binding protein [Mycobacteriales bacterium]